MLKIHKTQVSVEEYLAREEIAEHRSEFYGGDIFAMAGGTPNHNRIIVNIASLLNLQLKGGACEVFVSDLRVQVAENIHYAYPDVLVVRGALKFAQGRSDIIVNPVAIVEVLSESTQDYDRGSKFTAYRGIETLSDYILVDQSSVHIEYLSKEGDRIWKLRECFSMAEVFEINSIQAILPLGGIYERVMGI